MLRECTYGLENVVRRIVYKAMTEPVSEHHIQAARMSIEEAGGDVQLAIDRLIEENGAYGYFSNDSERRAHETGLQTVFEAVDGGYARMIPDNQPDAVCNSCFIKDPGCRVRSYKKNNRR